ncbi:MAG: 50S ribosomal protein L5 [Candidatus Zambryskibacteria bacterium RIFCSPHIGHO2_01_FULL_43_25]|uniref:Large ribosomal subunit protein uL5 n=1 Tax=Candidatus Zambryskibacteria bacterium RIFCSPLOWO2_01_FULL_45_21 TaxID=1802761 RepID=A0A1G2U4K2_9BACT|nr:MAG: 50S ribosomal protein L5 [Candidatus Zambryskibacteria bacterium RIFCSPHIGHO2_01_FULL_43_25]OHB00846.1 MAG: 50S ribosomal protein L5 [Candidatus Zambryskibacteria bacterium RIFCSPHIGHO2_12_FULL_44_12b]OHB04426.1 MAG: 50S ribosomal protein L5 [Candidatus Zambryskibacteria bacterium RIFCSPLOWO2_01_FULL_45_21]
MINSREKINKTFAALKDKVGYKNPMQAPRIEKMVINVGTGSFKDPKKKDLAADRLAKITGQMPAVRGAKQSIAAFKTRQGDPVGVQVTLRGKRMHDFLDRLINIALPRTKDFRGVSVKGIDQMGNYTIGIKEHTIFPETSDEELKDVFGLSVTIVTTAGNREEAESFFRHLGLPFKASESDSPRK